MESSDSLVKFGVRAAENQMPVAVKHCQQLTVGLRLLLRLLRGKERFCQLPGFASLNTLAAMHSRQLHSPSAGVPDQEQTAETTTLEHP